MKVFILEDDEQRMRYFREILFGAEIDHVESSKDTHCFVPPYDLIFLDHDLGGRQLTKNEDNGEEFCKWVKWVGIRCPIIIHSYNAGGAANMLKAIERQEPCAQVAYLPFMGNAFIAVVEDLKRQWKEKEHASQETSVQA